MDLKKLIICVSAIALVGGGFAGYWFNRPIAKANKAIESNEVAKVAEYYYKCNDEQRSSITEKMRHYCQELSVSYTNKEIEYEEVKEQYDLLDDDVMSDDETFANLVESVDLLHTSREAYKAGTAAFEAKDYATALSEYEKVLVGGENYDEVKANMEICKLELLPDFVGTWTNTLDIGPALAALMGMTGDDRFKLEMTSYYEFAPDGTGTKYADEEVLKKSFDEYMDFIAQLVIEKSAKEYGMSKEQLDKQFKAQYGYGVAEYIKKSIDLDEAFSDLDKQSFTYTVDGNTITAIDSKDNKVYFTREGDELLLDADENQANKDVLERMKIEYPLRLTKVK